MTEDLLPEPFRELEPWVAQWSIHDEHGRFHKRLSTPVSQLNRFVEAVHPRIEAIIDHLNTIPTADPDTLTPAQRRLFDLALMWMEASIPGDLDWEDNDIEDAWPADRLTFLNPSRLPEPDNRRSTDS